MVGDCGSFVLVVVSFFPAAVHLFLLKLMYFGYLVANVVSFLLGPVGNGRLLVALCVLAPDFSFSAPPFPRCFSSIAPELAMRHKVGFCR